MVVGTADSHGHRPHHHGDQLIVRRQGDVAEPVQGPRLAVPVPVQTGHLERSKTRLLRAVVPSLPPAHGDDVEQRAGLVEDVAVREQVIRSSADIPAELRKVLEGIEVGRLTPPEVTKFGVEMFAICAKKESTADNSPGKRQAKESLMAQRYEQRSKQYLQELRRGAMLEYK